MKSTSQMHLHSKLQVKHTRVTIYNIL